jgi:hypothetical protein
VIFWRSEKLKSVTLLVDVGSQYFVLNSIVDKYWISKIMQQQKELEYDG